MIDNPQKKILKDDGDSPIIRKRVWSSPSLIRSPDSQRNIENKQTQYQGELTLPQTGIFAGPS